MLLHLHLLSQLGQVPLRSALNQTAGSPTPPAAEEGEQLEFLFDNGTDVEENEMDAEGEVLEYTFSAEDHLYPWDMPPKKSVSDEEDKEDGDDEADEDEDDEEIDAVEEEVEPRQSA